jgi:peptide/nickel transport system ATP-binding protein
MSESSPLLDVNELRTSFRTREGKVEAVKGISFSLDRGKTLGIVGESGSGKSVTSLSIMRLLSANGQSTAESIFFHAAAGEKRDLNTTSEKEMRSLRGNELAMIFQEPMSSLNPVMRCGTQVVEALRLHKQIDAKAARAQCLELFRQVQLPRVEQIFEAYPHEISGGQKQRVMIAMAICCQPSLLIADEPTTALDVTVQKEILELLQRLQAEQGMSMIFITHDLGVVAEIADELIVMYQGEIVEAGSVEVIFAEPKHPYTQGLLACRPDLNQRLSRLPTVNDFLNGAEVEKRPQPEPKALDPDKSAAILEVKDLKTWFPLPKNLFSRQGRSYVRAVDEVSFSVFQGETLGLVGESGCGKTTLDAPSSAWWNPLGETYTTKVRMYVP